MPLVCRPLKPIRGLREVVWNTDPIPVHYPEVKFSGGIPLLRGFDKPFHGHEVIAGDTLAILVHLAEVVLRRSEALFSGLLEQRQSSAVILGHSLAIFVHGAGAELGLRYASRRCGFKPLGRQRQVALNTHTQKEHHGEIVLSVWIARFSRFREPLHRFGRALPHNLSFRKGDADARLSAPVAMLRLLY